ncbi:MAG: hypothetical protein E7632_01160 [Ruminococcaceae bacterium]|nr:hypothetical protein [Oscillospiraceae bacterium]
MKKATRSTAVFLLAAILSLNACGADPSASSDTTADTTAAETKNEYEFAGKVLEPYDFGGREFRFAVRGDSHSEFRCIDLYAENTNGDLINDAIYKRNSTVCELFNFEIVENRMSEYPTEAVRRAVMASTDEYDVVYDNLQRLADLSMDSMLIDLYTVNGFNFDEKYWDESINDQLTLKKQLYFTTGEHMLSVKSGLYGVFFNKTLLETFKLEDPYKLVAENKWTVEKMHEMSMDVSQDLNGDQKMDYNDQWGIVTETYNAYTILVNSGNLICDKNAEDLPELALNTESSIHALELASKMLTDKTTTILTDAHTSDLWNTVWNIFDTGRSLFREGALIYTPQLRSSDLDFGILPSPLLSEDQKEYFHTISVWNASLMSVPSTVANADEIARMLDILAAASYDTLRPAYYDVQLVNKLIRDTDSEGMLDIIFSTITFDLGAVYDFGGLFWGVIDIGNGKAPFASKYSSCEASALKAIDKLIEEIES